MKKIVIVLSIAIITLLIPIVKVIVMHQCEYIVKKLC